MGCLVYSSHWRPSLLLGGKETPQSPAVWLFQRKHISQKLYLGPCRSGLWNPGRVYDLYGEMLAALNTFSLVFCVFLMVKVGVHCHQYN